MSMWTVLDQDGKPLTTGDHEVYATKGREYAESVASIVNGKGHYPGRVFTARRLVEVPEAAPVEIDDPRVVAITEALMRDGYGTEEHADRYAADPRIVSVFTQGSIELDFLVARVLNLAGAPRD
jgi:hypothetical protein